MAPIVILLGLAVAFAALAAEVLYVSRTPLYRASFNPGLPELGLHGPPVVARAFGAFGLGLLLGAGLGRAVPALVLGAVLALGLVVGGDAARQAWLDMQKTVVIADGSSAQAIDWQGELRGSAWLTADGTRVDDEVALAQVPAGVSDADAWLEDQGYRRVATGVSEDVARGWASYEAIGFILVGAGSLAAAIVVVNRRRPT